MDYGKQKDIQKSDGLYGENESDNQFTSPSPLFNEREKLKAYLFGANQEVKPYSSIPIKVFTGGMLLFWVYICNLCWKNELMNGVIGTLIIMAVQILMAVLLIKHGKKKHIKQEMVVNETDRVKAELLNSDDIVRDFLDALEPSKKVIARIGNKYLYVRGHKNVIPYTDIKRIEICRESYYLVPLFVYVEIELVEEPGKKFIHHNCIILGRAFITKEEEIKNFARLLALKKGIAEGALPG